MKRKILIALTIVILPPCVVILWLFAQREPPSGPRIAGGPTLVGVEAGGAYAWIVRTAHGAVLIDAGLDASGTAILAELSAQGVQAGEVQAVLLTHGHPDHYAAASLFDKASIVAGAGDVAMIRGDTSHYSAFGKIIGKVMPLPPAPRVDVAVRGGEDLEFDGARFHVVATPGHSPGSVMYLYQDVLFTGDSLMRKKDGVTIVPSLFSDDAAMNRASLRALEPLAFDTIADGHAGLASGAKQKLARFLSGS